jgi:hypothetical protein
MSRWLGTSTALALVGSLDVRYMKADGPHWYASTQMFLGAK